MNWRLRGFLGLFLFLIVVGPVGGVKNLVPDSSFEEPMEKDRWGHVFAKWGGWIYEGECEFRVSDVAHSGKHSLLMMGGTNPKIRAWPEKLSLSPGRYRIIAYLRGLDIGTNADGQSTELMFDEKYIAAEQERYLRLEPANVCRRDYERVRQWPSQFRLDGSRLPLGR